MDNVRLNVVGPACIDQLGADVSHKCIRTATAFYPDNIWDGSGTRAIIQAAQEVARVTGLPVILVIPPNANSCGGVSEVCSVSPPLPQAASDQGVPPIVLDGRFTKSVEMSMDDLDEVSNASKKPVSVRDYEAIRAIQENTAAIKENTVAMENAVFKGAFRAQARFSPPDDEVEIEKVVRLKHDGWRWENIVLTVYPDSGGLPKGEFNKLIDATKKLYQRECELAESRKPGEGWASLQ